MSAMLDSPEVDAVPGTATRLGRELSEWGEKYSEPLESNSTEQRLASCMLMKKRETRIAVRLGDGNIE